ncbi:hypothetical protein J2I47_02770 [Fibrella sp. HMF5335]|uniref:Uncharacterized protein n=1 Tax=Fibrella rubiginis TaxID=2817060 RepID=A0A939GF98_9BACT|nr:hypothetical protein [Fibrella rubiginis]MBO0935462.1 hypothetical protein [Fibrella rubiginis]
MKFVTFHHTRRLPRFWWGVASLFDFTGSMASIITDDLKHQTVEEALRSDAMRIAQDVRRVYDQEVIKIGDLESCDI